MTTIYTDWITNYPEGVVQDDVDADESRDEELWENGDEDE